MKNLLIAFTVFTFIFGCATLPKSYSPVGHNVTISNSNITCQKLFDNICKKWGNHNRFETCFFFNIKLVSNIIENKNCFVGLNEDDIQTVFGKPTVVTPHKFKYNMAIDCKEIDTLFSMHSLYFKFENGKVRTLQYSEASEVN